MTEHGRAAPGQQLLRPPHPPRTPGSEKDRSEQNTFLVWLAHALAEYPPD
jgi:hypothetical protein